VHSGFPERRVVRRRARTDVAGRAREPFAHDLLASPVLPDDGVELAFVPVRVGQRTDPPRVVQERVGIADLRLEDKLICDIGKSVTVVVDVDRIKHVVSELKEVRAARRHLGRKVVGDDRDRIRLVRTDKRVCVSVVSHGVLADLWRLSVR
jgi:hypothetical protein